MPGAEGGRPSTASQWISLFDGESFEHWRGYRQEQMPAGWVIEEGCMAAAVPGHGMDIVSRKSFTNFEFEFDWKVAPGGNSGVMWHVDESAGDYPWMSGPEYQLLDDAAFHGGEIGKNSAGSDYDVYAPTVAVTRPGGEWNQARILVDGPHVEHWLNGVKVVEYQKGSEDYQARVSHSKWAQMPSYDSKSSGLLAIQGDHGQVWFRKLRIRELP